MPNQPPNPTPGKLGPVKSFTTPKVGDVVFFELRNSKKAEYKEPPAFGTCHPSKNTYPNHVFVFLTPADGMEDHWQKWYYAACRGDQDDYNFEKSESAVTRTYVVPRSEYLDGTWVPPTQGDADPEFAGYCFTGEVVQKRTDDKVLDSHFVVLTTTYVNDGRVLSESERGTARGEEGTETTEGCTQTANAVGSGIILHRSSKLTEREVWRNTEDRLSLREGIHTTSDSQRVGYNEVSTNEFSRAEPANNSDCDFAKKLVTQDADGIDAVWSAQRKNRTSNPASGSETSQFLGGGIVDVDIDLVADTTSADDPASNIKIVSSKVSPIGCGDAIKETKTIDAYPTLVEEKYDASLDAMITITKEVVDASTVSPGDGSFIRPNEVGTPGAIEYKPYDKWRTIKISTVVNDLDSVLSTPYAGTGVGSTLPGVFSYRFPAVLKSAQWIGAYAYAGNGDKEEYEWDFDVALVFDVEEAYSASVEGRTLRIVTGDPDAIVSDSEFQPTNFRPQSHTVGFVTAGHFASNALIWAKAQARTWQTPLALSGYIDLTFPLEGPQVNVVTSAVSTAGIPATSPPAIPLGWITIGVTTRRLKLGYYEVLVRQINAPGP